jgi:hypothetical protein
METSIQEKETTLKLVNNHIDLLSIFICDRIRKLIFSKMSTLQLLLTKLGDVFCLGTSVNGEGCATFFV